MTDQPSRLAVALVLHQAWWDDHPTWHGHALYLDEDTAKEHAAHDYLDDEYGPQDDEEPTYRPTLTWVEEYARWHLLADGTATGVQIATANVYRTA
ncbi:hypothetical protein ACH4TP_38010 [Streptomyces sp. NPDC021012]|uniref:hypothetical protein n=1 Tax=Streptomyces sp. NPDC021012 TaxID=3365107 RepID=UPI003797AD46